MQTDPNDSRLEDCLATPHEVLRTALRLFCLNMQRGLSRLPAKIRQSPEARQATHALYGVNDFLVQGFDQPQLMAEVARLGDALVPLATAHGCCPFLLNLYATKELPWRGRKKSAANVYPLKR